MLIFPFLVMNYYDSVMKCDSQFLLGTLNTTCKKFNVRKYNWHIELS